MNAKLLTFIMAFLCIMQSKCQPDNIKNVESKVGKDLYEDKKIKKNKEVLKKILTPMQYIVTQEKGTEPPFTGKFDNFYEKGTYHCVVCDLLLFNADSKFKSGCGWPSFFDLAKEKNINYSEDTSLNKRRIEVTCARCDAHLGHIFNDGPPPTYLRYCINSASLTFKKK